MDVYAAIEARHSVRAYASRPVEEEKLQRLLGVARSAPTARNRQSWRLVVVRDAETRQALAAAANQPFLGQAPVILAMVGLTPDESMYCTIPTDPVDGAIVLDHITLAAASEGLGTCWIGHFDQDSCRDILEVPDSARIIELMPLGYAATSGPESKTRKPLSELVCEDRFR